VSDVFSDAAEYEEAPPGYHAGEVMGLAKGTGLNVRVYEVPPGESTCPYHYEYEEEWLIVLEGEVLLRTPGGERTIGRGEVVCFPPGPDGAHKTSNGGSHPARILMFSSAREPAFAVYPDSDKIGAWPGRKEDEVMLHRADGNVDYWEGER
jgi:uncharacterized cupin superfamily protein